MSESDELLSKAELHRLTGCHVRDAQCQELEQLGVPYIRRGARVLVSRELMRQRMLGVELKQSAGPRLDLVK